MERYLSMRQNFSLMSRDFYTNISLIPDRSFLLWSYQNLGNIQF